jgi:hypothetical protein
VKSVFHCHFRVIRAARAAQNAQIASLMRGHVSESR